MSDGLRESLVRALEECRTLVPEAQADGLLPVVEEYLSKQLDAVVNVAEAQMQVLAAERDRLLAGIPLVCSDERHQAKVRALEATLAGVREYLETSDDDGIATREIVLGLLAGRPLGEVVAARYERRPRAPMSPAAAAELRERLASGDVARREVRPIHGRLGGGEDAGHRYLSTGCWHGDMRLPDGRSGHEYCRGETGACGAKVPASCKHCGAPCECPCHRQEDAPPAAGSGADGEQR